MNHNPPVYRPATPGIPVNRVVQSKAAKAPALERRPARPVYRLQQSNGSATQAKPQLAPPLPPVQYTSSASIRLGHGHQQIGVRLHHSAASFGPVLLRSAAKSATRPFANPSRPAIPARGVSDRIQRMEVKKSYLYLGSGDFSAPLNKALKHSSVDDEKFSQGLDPESNHSRTLDQGYSIVATELNSRQQSLEKYRDSFLENIYDLQNIGGTLIEQFDGTRYPNGTETFDRIIFMNPHSGTYGGTDFNDMRAVASNENLLRDVFKEAKGHLKSGGMLQIHICGWPYKSDPYRQQEFNKGLQLDYEQKAREFAVSLGFEFVAAKDKGLQTIRRNNGDIFKANVIKLSFRPK